MREDWLFGPNAIACGHRGYLLLFLYVHVSSRWNVLIPSILLSAVLAASSCVVSFFPPRSPCLDLCPLGCGGRVGGGSFLFTGARWAVCRVFLPFPALFCPLLSFWRPSCFFKLVQFFRWRRPQAVLFSIPGGVCRPPCFCARASFSRIFLLSSPFIPFCFFAASLPCMYSVALHTSLCLRRLVCVCIVWAYLSLPMHVGWACSLGYTSSLTILLSAVLAPRLPPPSPRLGPGLTCCWPAPCSVALWGEDPVDLTSSFSAALCGFIVWHKHCWGLNLWCVECFRVSARPADCNARKRSTSCWCHCA